MHNRLIVCGKPGEKRVHNNKLFFLAAKVVETYLHYALEKQQSAKKKAIQMHPKPSKL